MSSDRVNDLLHTLRGEQFRHAQNVLRSRTHISSSYTHNTRTLPQGLVSSIDDEDVSVHNPPPDMSIGWPKGCEFESPSGRAHALSLIYDHLPSREHIPAILTSNTVPPLTLLCLRVLHSSCSNHDLADNILPFVPPHLRRDLLRYTSVHSPLANPGSLCGPCGHADGELIVVGPYASLRGDDLRRCAGSRTEMVNDEEGLSWDSPALHDEWTSTLLHTMVLLSVNVPSATFLTFPPTLTHLALIALPSVVPFHRLPDLCPLITVIDLSYNKWLETAKSTAGILERVAWTRWGRLEVLGLRGCWVTEGLCKGVNKGRWTDVVIIR